MRQSICFEKNTNEVPSRSALSLPASVSRTCMQTHAHSLGLRAETSPSSGRTCPLVPAVHNIESGSSPHFWLADTFLKNSLTCQVKHLVHTQPCIMRHISFDRNSLLPTVSLISSQCSMTFHTHVLVMFCLTCGIHVAKWSRSRW